MNENIGLEYDRLLGEGAYGKVFLVKQQDGQQVFIFQISVPTLLALYFKIFCSFNKQIK